jgi:hypothetical protein
MALCFVELSSADPTLKIGHLSIALASLPLLHWMMEWRRQGTWRRGQGQRGLIWRPIGHQMKGNWANKWGIHGPSGSHSSRRSFLSHNHRHRYRKWDQGRRAHIVGTARVVGGGWLQKLGMEHRMYLVRWRQLQLICQGGGISFEDLEGANILGLMREDRHRSTSELMDICFSWLLYD